MCENEYEPRLGHHVDIAVGIVAMEYHDRLLAGNSFADVALVLASVVLPGLQRAKAGRPTSLVAFLHQVVDYVERAARVGQRSFDSRLESAGFEIGRRQAGFSEN